MKKVLLIAVMAIVALGASAQVEKGFRFGVQLFGGANAIGLDGANAGCSYGGGVIAEYNFDQNLYLASGLNYQNKSWEPSDAIIEALWGSNSVASNYLTLPIHVGYRVYLNNNQTSDVFFEAGPQLGYGIHGTTIDVAGLGLATSPYSEWAKRFEAAIGIKIGFEIKSFQVGIATNYGLTNCFQSNSGHNLDATINLGYMF